MDLKALTLESFDRFFSQGDLAFVDEVLGGDAVDHQEALGTDFREHLKRVIVALRTAFPDLRFEVQAVVAEGDLVATRSLMTGTHRARLSAGPAAAIEPSGRRVSVPHMHFFQYRDGRLCDLWHVWDTPRLLDQLGAPAPKVAVG